MKEVVTEKIDGIPEIEFHKKRNVEVEFEIMPLERLYKRHREGRIGFDIQRFYRARFNQIILIEGGYGRHFVDFCGYSYEPGDLILVASNQVQAFDAVEPEEAGWFCLPPSSWSRIWPIKRCVQ